MLGNNMFAYCRNNPVSRADISGREDVERTDLDGNEFTDDEEMIGAGKVTSNPTEGSNVGNSSGSGTSPSGGGSYQPPAGGGGVTNTVNVDGTAVDFGHGGRHVDADGVNIADVENAIANDVVNRPPSYGQATSVNDFMYGGQPLYYSYYTREPSHINVGTYYFMEQLR